MEQWEDFNVSVNTESECIVLTFKTNDEDDNIKSFELSIRNAKTLKRMLKHAIKLAEF